MLGNERNIFVLNIMYNCCEHVFFFFNLSINSITRYLWYNLMSCHCSYRRDINTE